MSKRGIAFDDLRFSGDDAMGENPVGNYIVGQLSGDGSADTSDLADRLQASACFIPRSLRLDRMGVQIQTAQASGSVRFGIYGSLASGQPGSLILDAGTIDASTTGFKEITIDLPLSGPRMYWTAAVWNDTGLLIRGRSNNSTSTGFSAGGNTSPNHIVKKTHTFGVLPDPFGSTIPADKPSNIVYMRVV